MYPQNVSTLLHPDDRRQNSRQGGQQGGGVPSAYHGRPNDMRGPADWNRYWMDRMALELSRRNPATSTRDHHLSALSAFLASHRCPPSSLRADAIGKYLLGCKEERGMSAASINQILAALVFFFEHVVKAPYCITGIPRVQDDKALPDILGPGSLKGRIEATGDGKHRLALSLAYGYGLRPDELTRLKWTDLDAERGVLRIRKSKGGKAAKERMVTLSASMVEALNGYRKQHQPVTYLFESGLAGRPLGKRTVQAVLEKAGEKLHPFETGSDRRFIQSLLGLRRTAA
jgi:integrase/recombinase XerD